MARRMARDSPEEMRSRTSAEKEGPAVGSASSAGVKEIGPLPAVADPARRKACERRTQMPRRRLGRPAIDIDHRREGRVHQDDAGAQARVEVIVDLRGIAGGESPPAQPLLTPPPPAGQGLDELIAWAARIQARAARLAEQGQDPERVRAIGVVVKALAKIKHAAADSERACAALRRFRGVSIDYDGELPPADDIGLCVWAAWRLGALLHSVCISMDLDEGAVQHRARTLSLLEQVQPQAAIDRVAADLADESGA